MVPHEGFELHHLRDDRDLRVFRGRRLGDDAMVLVVTPSAAEPSKETVAWLETSFALRSHLDTEWSTQPLDLFEHGGRTWLVLHDPGVSSLEALTGQPLATAIFLRLALGVARSLAHLHGRGLTHRDIKPGNLFVDAVSGRAWLSGFGLASRIPRQRQERESLDVIAGTLAYMAPEQTGRMNRSIDSRADLYAYGVTLYQLLTGELPFVASEPSEWVHFHIAKKPLRPDERVAGIPTILSDIVMKLLAKGAEDRYQTASGVAVDLRRCLAELDELGTVSAFTLAEHDVPDRLLVPEKLYGREGEVAELLRTFDRVVASSPELTLVSGYSGVGKSAVVNELHKALVPPNGLFATGKFDQYKRDIPYSTLAEALQGLVRMVLRSSEAELARWRVAISQAVGPNGGLVVALIPELEIIIGAQPAVPALVPQDEQARFQMVFTRFLGTFARREHPLALFLDDLQWVDSATLNLLVDILVRQELGYLMIIGAYRDNEVEATHPVALAIERIRSSGGSVGRIALEPLGLGVVTRFVADALHCTAVRAATLAQILHEKTGGNPFFVIQSLLALEEDGVIAFDAGSQTWRWDEPRLRGMSHTDNVVTLMAERLSRLPPLTLRSLQHLACVGNAAHIRVLMLVDDCSEREVHEAHWEAVRAGVVVRTGDAYSFLHDRVQEAAYSLMPDEARIPSHLRIGRLLLGELPEQPGADQLFAVLSHLNRAVELIDDPEERAALARLNQRAGQKALSSVAYEGACDYLRRSAALLPEDAWTHDYDGTFAIFLLLSECEFLAKSFEVADALFDRLLERARSNIDRAKVYVLRLKLYPVSGRYDAGVGVAIEALRLFDVIIPETDEEIAAATAAELDRVPELLAGRTIASIVDAPIVDDPVSRAVINLLVDAAPPTYIGRPKLFPLVTLRAVNLSLRHGNTDQSSFAYASYALMLVSMKGDIETASQFSDMTLRLNEKLGNRRLRGTLLHMHGDFICFWTRPFRESVKVLEQAFVACVDVGDLIYSAFVAFLHVWQTFEKGDALEQVLELTRPYASFVGHGRNRVVQEVIALEQRFLLAFLGRTDAESPSGSDFDENAAVKVLADAGFGSGLCFHQILRQILAFHEGRYEDSLLAADLAEANLAGMMALPPEATHYFYRALAILAVIDSFSDVERATHTATVAKIVEKHAHWRKHSPENYAHRHLLLSAEVARVEGRAIDAMRAYEDAIRTARASGAVQFEALAHELAGEFGIIQHLDTVAAAHLRHARAGYRRWGAEAKVRRLERAYPQWLAHDTDRADATFGTRVTSLLGELDVATVVAMSSSVSEEIVLDRLVDRLMTIAVEHAGATRGVLVLLDGDLLRVEAEATIGANAVEVSRPRSPSTSFDLPETVLRFVARSLESVILDDAITPSDFVSDPYIAARRTRSVLCLPLLKQGKLSGLLYLENSLSTYVFTPPRIRVLQLLASQAAISLENARLYAELRHSDAILAEAQRVSHTGSFGWRSGTGDVSWSAETRQIFGYSPETTPSIDLALARVHPDDVSAVSALFSDLRAGAWSIEHRLVMPDGEIKHVRFAGHAVEGLQGADGPQCIGAVTDVTEVKQSEAHRHAREIAESANRAKDIFLANVSHEIRTPMNAILGMTELVLDSSLRDDQRQSLQGVRSAAGNLLDIINDILDFSKIESGIVVLEQVRFRLRAALFETVRALAARAHRNGIELVCDVAPDVPDAIIGDVGRVRQVLLNLIGNAIKFTPVGEVVVEVRVVESGGIDRARLSFSVRDTGIGIAVAKQQAVFRAFEQEDTSTTRKYGGTGLGLTIASRLVELMGGTITLESAPAQGSVFAFDAWVGVEAEERRPMASSIEPFRGLRVLVVDDNAVNRNMLERWLRTWQMTPTAVEDGLSALNALWHASSGGEPYELVLLDSQMPLTDSLALARQIRHHAALAMTKIVLLTSGDRIVEDDRARDVRIDARISKPVPQDELRKTIGRVIGAAAGTRAPEAPVAASPLAPRDGGLHVLVAEDNELNASLVRQLLAKHGHSVEIASTGRAALTLAMAGAFDLVLLDLHMPELDGFEVTHAIRAHEATHGGHLPLIALTARARNEDRERCLAAGMDGFLVKPLRVDLLRIAIDEALSVAGSPDENGQLSSEILLAACGEDDGILTSLLAGLVPRLEEDVRRLRELQAGGRFVELREAAHSFCGMVAICSSHVSGIASELEERAADANAARGSELVRQLEVLVPRLVRALDHATVEGLRAVLASSVE